MTFYDPAKAVVSAILRTALRVRVVGAANVPRAGGLLVVANHVSNFDPPLLGIAVPRPVSYMAKKELFGIPVLGAILPRVNAFPVDRAAGGTAALRASLRMLKEGRCVGMFPEGGRNVHGDKRKKAARPSSPAPPACRSYRPPSSAPARSGRWAG